MARRYKAGVDRAQGQLLPMRVEDHVAQDNPVRALDAYRDSLDLQALGVTNGADGVNAGQPPYSAAPGPGCARDWRQAPLPTPSPPERPHRCQRQQPPPTLQYLCSLSGSSGLRPGSRRPQGAL